MSELGRSRVLYGVKRRVWFAGKHLKEPLDRYFDQLLLFISSGTVHPGVMASVESFTTQTSSSSAMFRVTPL